MRLVPCIVVLALIGGAAPIAMAPPIEPLTIHEIQSNTTDGDASEYDWEIVDCVGGIVVGKSTQTRFRIMLQDPEYPDGWGGIQVKDSTPGDLFHNVNLGDWVELTNVFVEEFRGGTFLQYEADNFPDFSVASEGNPLPPPILVPVTEIPAPLESPGDEWYVENHDAEPYESMRLIVRDVTVTGKDMGKAQDNYNLQTPDGNNCWAADYMNEDLRPSGYHDFVTRWQHFCAVTGLLEQYTDLLNGYDYYQLITLKTADLAICGDGDSDAEVDLDDLPRFDECLGGPLCDDAPGGCNPPAWTEPGFELPIQRCLMMDLDYDGDVDLHDFAGLQTIFTPPVTAKRKETP